MGTTINLSHLGIRNVINILKILQKILKPNEDFRFKLMQCEIITHKL